MGRIRKGFAVGLLFIILTFNISREAAYAQLRFEEGTQNVPETTETEENTEELTGGAEDSKTSSAFVIESAKAVMPYVTAYIRSDKQVGKEDITAVLDEKTLKVEKVEFFKERGEGITYYVLLDTSASFSTAYFDALKNSLVNFKRTRPDNDRLVLITFGTSVNTVLTGFEDAETAEGLIMALTNGDSDTHMYEALKKAAQEADNNSDNDREVIMLISDGGDDHDRSKANADEAISALTSRNLPVYGFAAGANEDNLAAFAEITDACKGTLTEFTQTETDKIFSNFEELLQNMQTLTLMADSNRTSNKAELLTITLNAGGAAAGIEVLVADHIPDTAAPEISAVRKTAETELTIHFSEPVVGADNVIAYKVTCDGILLDVVAADYNDADYSAVLKFDSVLNYGEYIIDASGITDDSMEANAVAGSFVRKLEASEQTENETETSAEEESESADEKSFLEKHGWKVIIVVLAVTVLAATVIFILLNMRKKNRQGKNSDEHIRNNGATIDTRRYADIDEKGKDIKIDIPGGRMITFEILNVEAEKNKRITAELSKSLIVGRAEICDIRISDKRVSRQHFALQEQQGNIYIQDLNTTNGTGVNGTLIKDIKRLSSGDVISAGTLKMRIRW